MSARDLPSSEPLQPPRGRPDGDLQALLFLVGRARAEQETQRASAATNDRIVAARWALMQALEAYTAALDVRCWPVPRRMHDEIRLLRALCGVGTGPPAIRP